jgi:hypothetical protein
MNSALSVPWGAVGCSDNRGITLLHLLVTIDITGTMLAAGALEHRLGNTRLRRRSGAPANLLRAAERPHRGGHREPPLHVYRDRGRKLLGTGWLECRGEDPTHGGIGRHLDLGAECDRIRVVKDGSECDDRHPSEFLGRLGRRRCQRRGPGQGRMKTRRSHPARRGGQSVGSVAGVPGA